jgi:Ca2+-transporting ATPase
LNEITPAAGLRGLDPQEAAIRLARDGPNALEDIRRRSTLQRMGAMLGEPMFALLVAAVVIYLVLGDLGEGAMLGVFVLAVLGLTFYQEGKSEASIAALRSLTQHQTQVVRGGWRIKLAARDVVCGDIVVLGEGSRVPADGYLLSGGRLQVDESLLTGESLPVDKRSDAASSKACSLVFAGTFVVAGHALALVTATGARMEIGKIGSSLAGLDAEATPLQQQTARLVRVMAGIAFVLCTAMVLALGLRTGLWLPALLSGIALAMTMLPEEYPVVLAIFPALGAHRLAKEGVLTRRINAIETLGATTVLCTDKTGTLTHNRMQVHTLVVESATHRATSALPVAFEPLAEHAILASLPHPFDPMEVAFHDFGRTWMGTSTHQHLQWDLVHTYPLRPTLLAITHVWRVPGNTDMAVATKGAPEAVMDLCRLSTSARALWTAQTARLAAQGLRVLAVAQATHHGAQMPACAESFSFTWLGLIGLADPLRDEVPEAMEQCRQAGIRVIMITGDYPLTARVIADQAGMPPSEVLTGSQVDALDALALQARLAQTSVCARITPHQKLRIVQALKASGEIVAMTGDGVNDAPALRAAHVGIAMGLRGTDVAREAAALVLVDDNFASIVKGIRVGRRVFANLRMSMAYIFSVHVPIAALALVPMLFALPPLLLPLHIAMLELIIDPACTLAFEGEPEDPSAMLLPPRDTRKPLFGRSAMMQAFGQGMLMLLGAGLAYGLAQNADWGSATPERTRAMVLVAFVVANAFLIFNTTSISPRRWRGGKPFNRMALFVALAAITLVLAAIYASTWIAVLNFDALDTQSLLLAAGCGTVGLWFKLLRHLPGFRPIAHAMP